MRLEVKGLSRDWGGFSLRDISLSLCEGEYFVLLGPCGSGKTMLMNTLAGFYRPDSGSIELGGKDITFLPAEKRGIGYLFQTSCLFPHMDVRANIFYGLKYSGQGKRRAEALLGILGIGDELLRRKDILNLSGGEARKVALARTLAVNPGVLLLDEPLSFLDPFNRETVTSILLKLKKELSMTVIHVTHDIEEAVKLSDRAAILLKGRIAACADMQELLKKEDRLLKEQYWGEHV